MFKVGDKVMVITPSWQGECTVSRMGYGHRITFVRRANGTISAIYTSWASIIKSKNQQLEFDFMQG